MCTSLCVSQEITLAEEIGRGEFGTVYKATWRGMGIRERLRLTFHVTVHAKHGVKAMRGNSSHAVSVFRRAGRCEETAYTESEFRAAGALSEGGGNNGTPR